MGEGKVAFLIMQLVVSCESSDKSNNQTKLATVGQGTVDFLSQFAYLIVTWMDGYKSCMMAFAIFRARLVVTG